MRALETEYSDHGSDDDEEERLSPLHRRAMATPQALVGDADDTPEHTTTL
jgi:hypothetical protein